MDKDIKTIIDNVDIKDVIDNWENIRDDVIGPEFTKFLPELTAQIEYGIAERILAFKNPLGCDNINDLEQFLENNELTDEQTSEVVELFFDLAEIDKNNSNSTKYGPTLFLKLWECLTIKHTDDATAKTVKKNLFKVHPNIQDLLVKVLLKDGL